MTAAVAGVLQRLREMAAASPRREICGVIDSSNNIYPVTNISPEPDQFVMSKPEYFRVLNEIEEKDETVQAIYHSHPRGSTEASARDLAFLKRSKVDMLIVTGTDWRYYPYE